jgi:hypothetical protein
MTKAGLFLLFLPAAVLAAGLFGMIHDQISYSVSPEYFTKFKFIQVRLLVPDIPERIRAAQVGFLASWWMGIPLSLLCGSAGFVQRSPALMQSALAWSVLLIVTFTLAVALTGLAYGWQHTAAPRHNGRSAHREAGPACHAAGRRGRDECRGCPRPSRPTRSSA